MPYWIIIWTDQAWDKIEQRGLDPNDVEQVVRFPARREQSRASDRMIAIGWTSADENIAVVYEHADPDTIILITAYRVE